MFGFLSRQKVSIGLDIKGGYIRFVQISKDGEHNRISAFGEVVPEKAVFEAGEIKDPALLASYLKMVRKQVAGREVYVCLPDEAVFFVKLSLPAGRDFDKRALEEVLRQKSLMTFDDEILSFEKLSAEVARGVEGTQIFEIVIGKKIVLREYRKVLSAAGFSAMAFLVSPEALYRACVPAGSDTSFLLAGAEKDVCQIVVSDPKEKVFENCSAENHKIISTLNDVYIGWYDAHKEKVNHLLFAGARANDLEFVNYVSRELKIPIARANVFVNLDLNPEEVPPITKDDSFKYAVAIGLVAGVD